MFVVSSQQVAAAAVFPIGPVFFVSLFASRTVADDEVGELVGGLLPLLTPHIDQVIFVFSLVSGGECALERSQPFLISSSAHHPMKRAKVHIHPQISPTSSWPQNKLRIKVQRSRKNLLDCTLFLKEGRKPDQIMSGQA